MRLVFGLLAALIALAPMAGSAQAAADPAQTLSQAAPTAVPKALYLDPPVDAAHPATTLEIEVPSHGALMNAIIYRPSGPGPFPLVVFVHGLPGNEQSLDLAQTLRRAGWAVLTFHYRGAFGSEGTFSIDNTLEDADAVIDRVRAPGVAAAWNIDPARLVLMGHSLGGLAAAHASAHAPERLATVLIAPWDPSILAGILRPMTPEQRHDSALKRWSDTTHGRLAGTTPDRIAADVVDHGERWRLADAAPGVAARPALIITATRDLASSKAGALKSALAALHMTPDAVELDSDHSFNDRRIGLQTTILQWLAKLPGAPAGP